MAVAVVTVGLVIGLVIGLVVGLVVVLVMMPMPVVGVMRPMPVVGVIRPRLDRRICKSNRRFRSRRLWWCWRRRRRRIRRRLVPNALSFQIFHIFKPVDFPFRVIVAFFEFFTVNLFRIFPLHYFSIRLPSIGAEHTLLVKVPVLQGFVLSIHGGCFGALALGVSKPLAPDMLAVLGHIDYLGVKR